MIPGLVHPLVDQPGKPRASGDDPYGYVDYDDEQG